MSVKNSLVGWIATLLAAIGAVNWGLVGVLDFNLVAAILGEKTTLSSVVYALVGASGVYLLLCLTKVICTKTEEHKA